MKQSQSFIPLSIRISPDLRNQLEDLAGATGRTRSYLAAKAIELYLLTQAWQIQAIEKAVKKANTNGAKFVEHEKVTTWLSNWGTEDEKENPE